MSVLVLACFISSMTNSATSISLPNMIATLGTTQALAQNLISFYSICLGIVSACSAFLVNKFNTRPFFMTCVGLFCLASVGLTFSTNIWMALAFKILQGLAAGSLTPMATMVALAIYPADRKGFGTSIIGMVMFASPALAPTIAGILLDNFTFRGVFAFISIWSALVFVLAKFFLINVTKNGTVPRPDVASVALYAVGFSAFNVGMTNLSLYGAGNIRSMGLLILAVVLLAVFVVRNLKGEQPLLHLSLLKSRKYAICVFLACVVYLNMMLIEQMSQQYLQVIRGFAATKAGILTTCASILVIVINPLAGKFYDKKGGKPLCLIGFLAMTVGIAGLMCAGAWMPIPLVILFYGIGNLANGWMLFPLSAYSTAGLPGDKVNHGVAIPNSFRLMFGAVMGNVIVQVAARCSAGDMIDLHGFTLAMTILLVIIVIALLLVLFGLKKTD